MLPLVSIVMPAFNEERNIAKAIESMLAQTYSNFELIAVDDGSTDNTKKIIETYKEKDSRIILISKTNSGVADSLNQGIALATGKYIARMDADDYSYPTRIEKQVIFMEQNPDYFLLGTWGIFEYKNTGKKVKITPPTTNKKLRQELTKDNPFIHSSVIFRRSPLHDGLNFYYSIKGMEDYDLWIRIAKKYSIAMLDEILVTRYEENNFYTKKTYEGLKKRNMYKNRLKLQIKAATLSLNYKYLFFLSKTILSILLTYKKNEY